MGRKLNVDIEVDFDDNGAVRGVRQIEGGLSRIEGAGVRASRGVGMFAVGLGAAVASGALAVRGMVQLGAAALVTGAKFETLAIQMNAVMGSMAAGERATQWVKDFTISTPYQLDQVTGAFVKLKAMGLNPMSGAMQSVADATSFLGGSAETLNSLVLALGKSFTVGKMSMEEMRMMMEKGVPVIDILADKLGVTNTQILEMSRKGQIGREQIQLLIDAMGEMYGGASQALMDTLTGKWSNLQDQIDKTMNAMANTGAMDMAKGFLDIMITGLGNVGDLLEELSEEADFSNLIESMNELSRATESLTDTLSSGNAKDALAFLLALSSDKLAQDLGIVAAGLRMTGAAADAWQKAPGWKGMISGIQAASGAVRENKRDVFEMVKAHETAEEQAKKLAASAEGLLDQLKLMSGQLTETAAATAEIDSRTEDYGLTLKDLEYQARLNAAVDEYWLGIVKEGAEGARQALLALVNTPVKIPLEPLIASANLMQSTFSDLLGKGFMGELETFADLWDSIWQDLAKSMTGILGDAFDGWLQGTETEEGRGGLFARFKDAVGGNRLGAGLAGAGMIYAGAQQGGTGGVLQGAMGGAMAGTAIMPGIGTVVGAIVGGAMAYFGQGDNPSSSGRVGLTGGQVTGSRGQDLGSGAWDLFSRERVEEYRGSVMAMNDVLRLFADGSLFDMIGDAPVWAFSGGGSLDHFAQVFREQWLPDAMRGMFEGAINQGLGGLGVSDRTINQLWSEVGDLTGSNQIGALSTFIGSLVDATNLYDDMNWDAIQDAARQDSLSAFLGGMGDALGNVQMQMLGLDQMTLLERADQATTITQLMSQARQAEISMLTQIDALQTGINRSIDQQIEGLRTGGMTDSQRQGFYAGQIDTLMDQLRAGIASPEALQQMMGDLQRYVGLYQGSLGDQLYQVGFSGQSISDQLIATLQEARGLSDAALEGMRDRIQAANEELVNELRRLINALQNAGDGGGPLGIGAAIPGIGVDIGIDLNVDVDWIRAQVRAEVNDAFAEYTYHGPN